jgi:thiamine pyrophosphate-dependent acetolactate synthase large subunit-like protein
LHRDSLTLKAHHLWIFPVIAELNNQIKDRDDVIITTGVGQHQMFAAQFIEWKHPCAPATRC